MLHSFVNNDCCCPGYSTLRDPLFVLDLGIVSSFLHLGHDLDMGLCLFDVLVLLIIIILFNFSVHMGIG